MSNHDDDVVVVGAPLPRLVSIEPSEGFNAAVVWEAGTRPKEREIADLPRQSCTLSDNTHSALLDIIVRH